MTGVELQSLVVTELRLHRRHGVWVAVAATALAWAAVLVALPSGSRPTALHWLLFLEVATLGFVALPALAIVERANGVTASLRLTRLSPAGALAVRVGLLAGYAAAVAVLLLIAAGKGLQADVLTAAAATSALLSLVAVLMVGRANTLTAYIARMPLVAAPLIGPALLDGSGLMSHPLLLLSPATAALRLLAGEWSPLATGWLLAWIVALAAAAGRIGFNVRPVRQRGTAARGGGPRRTHVTRARRHGTATAVRSFAQVDRNNLLGDRLLVLLLVGLPLIALLARWFAGPGIELIQARTGADLAAHLPAIWAFVLVIHVPVVIGTLVGLLWAEDRDAGLLPALATVPASLHTLAAYRLGAAALATALTLTALLLLAGVSPAAGVPGLAATAAAGGIAATVPAALTATLARDRVQAVAVMKAMSVPLYLPVAGWFLDPPAAWLLTLVPTGGAANAFWAAEPTVSALFAVGTAAVTAALLVLLLPRMLRNAKS